MAADLTGANRYFTICQLPPEDRDADNLDTDQTGCQVDSGTANEVDAFARAACGGAAVERVTWLPRALRFYRIAGTNHHHLVAAAAARTREGVTSDATPLVPPDGRGAAGEPPPPSPPPPPSSPPPPRIIDVSRRADALGGCIRGIDAASGAAVAALEVPAGARCADVCCAPGGRLFSLLEHGVVTVISSGGSRGTLLVGEGRRSS